MSDQEQTHGSDKEFERAQKAERDAAIAFGSLNISERFALINRMITRDINNDLSKPTFYRYTKDKINEFLADPNKNEINLRNAIRYIYGASSHFRRLIQYFVGLSNMAYVVSPYRIDPKKASPRIVNNNYRKVLNLLSIMNIETQFPKILTVCLREDVFYGTFWHTEDSIAVQQLPSDYCAITAIEGGVFNVSFDFSYFSRYPGRLAYYPEEFTVKYRRYRDIGEKSRWIELDSPNSFAIKCSKDIVDYILPPFAGILREVYDIEDYKQMRLTRTALENYAMVVMKLPLNDDGTWGLDLTKARDFWSNLSSVLPQEIGAVLSPMDVEKISFDRPSDAENDTISDAEQNLFTAAGVSSLLFNNTKASANALLLSIKADQSLTYGIVKSIEDVVNRFVQSQSFGKFFKVTFLNVSPYNQKEAGDAYLKACQYGIPMISYYCASQGLGQAELDSMSFLETDVLGLQKMFKPLVNSSNASSDEGNGATEEGGAPLKDDGELTETGEETRELGSDWG